MRRLTSAAAILAALVVSALVFIFMGQRLPPVGTAGREDGPAIVLTVLDDGTAVVDVVGLRADMLSWLRQERPPEAWATVLRVSVASNGHDGSSPPPAMIGRHGLEGDRLRFTPAFPLDPGRAYEVVFRPEPPGGTLAATLALPERDPTPPTTVSRIYPSSPEVPENLLRLYVEFSGPMGRKGGLEYVHLFDAEGREVIDPFLPLDAEFWNGDRTRYTVFFDPGRQKRGILPNQQMGRSLEAGRTYTLLIGAAWRDTNGRPLTGPHRRELRVGPSDERPLDPASWTVATPRAASREPLVVTFPEPLDRGLLLRALGVAAAGSAIRGDVGIGDGEQEWRFTPHEPWQARGYELVALAMLEDLAGNRIGRAFEVDQFDRVDRSPEPERTSIPFTVR